jgi:hypothetical protein
MGVMGIVDFKIFSQTGFEIVNGTEIASLEKVAGRGHDCALQKTLGGDRNPANSEALVVGSPAGFGGV